MDRDRGKRLLRLYRLTMDALAADMVHARGMRIRALRAAWDDTYLRKLETMRRLGYRPDAVAL
jgi:hypothetical protein